jgi:hypothetical protein
LCLFLYSFFFVLFREQRNKEEKARLEQERLILQQAETQYLANRSLLFSIIIFLFRKKQKKTGPNQPAAGKGGVAPTSGSDKGASAATAATAAGVAAAGGKTSARPTLISARGPPVTDRPMTKNEGASVEENDK